MSIYHLAKSEDGWQIEFFNERLSTTQVAIKDSTIEGLNSKISIIREAVLEMKREKLEFSQKDFIPPHDSAGPFLTVRDIDNYWKYLNDLRESCISYYVSVCNWSAFCFIDVRECVGRGFSRTAFVFKTLDEADYILLSILRMHSGNIYSLSTVSQADG
jgi:hypothetical protein